LAILVVLPATLAVSARATELVLAHFVSTNHPMHRAVFVPLAARLLSDSGGELTLRINPGLSDPARQYQRVTNREADLVFGLPDYTPELFPRTRLIELPELAHDPGAATRMLGNGLPRTLAPEYSAVIPLGLWVGEPAVLVSSGRAIHTLADVAGRRIRVADPGAARLVELWGATPVILTANQILPAFQSSEIDAALIGASGIAPFQLDTVAKACTLNLPVVLTSFYLLMNRQAWEALPGAQQEVLRAATGLTLSLSATSAYDEAGRDGLTKLQQANAEIVELTHEQAAPFQAGSRTVVEESLGLVTAQGIDGQKVLENFRPRLTVTRAVSSVEIRAHGAEGLVYGLSSSVDLLTWTPLDVRVGDGEGEAMWSVPLVGANARVLRAEVR